ncbi:hypothetical protein, partial [Escherichia coli]
HFSAYLTLWFPLLIWWTPLCLIRQILTRRFRLYAYQTPSYILDVCGVFLQITDSQYSLREKYFNYLL